MAKDGVIMSVINDMAAKAAHWNKPVIYAEDHAEKLKCSLCGKEYVSRGKFDCGICRECERAETEKTAMLIGGPYSGQKVGDANDKS